MRNAAASAIPTKCLSAEHVCSVGYYGFGKHAQGQLEAICAVRPIKLAYIYSCSTEKLEAFTQRISKRLGVEVRTSEIQEEPASAADIVVTCTTSFEPVLFGDWLTKPGLVIGAGANHWNGRDLDESIIKKSVACRRDERETAKKESGALLLAVHSGIVSWDQVENLADIVVKRRQVPKFDPSSILFASYGLALEDVAISNKVYELAKQKGLGRHIQI